MHGDLGAKHKTTISQNRTDCKDPILRQGLNRARNMVALRLAATMSERLTKSLLVQIGMETI